MKKTIILLGTLTCFSSCFKSYVQMDITSQWKQGKMEELTRSKTTVEVYFTNKVVILSDPHVDEDQLTGMISTLETLHCSGSIFEENDPIPDSIQNAAVPVTQIFISEQFSNQDTVVINSKNFLQMREYKIDRPATVMSHIAPAAGILTLVIIILGTIVYYRYLTSPITSTL